VANLNVMTMLKNIQEKIKLTLSSPWPCMKRGAKLIATSDELPWLINVGLEDHKKKKKTIKCCN
jgi:hypothetical protein